MTNKLYIASIVFTSGDTLDDPDNPMSVRVIFDPETTPENVEPPAFIIARDVFISDIQRSIKTYIESMGKEVEYEYIPLEDLLDQEEIEGEDPPRTTH